jgi:alpha-1,3-glucosyltransferase
MSSFMLGYHVHEKAIMTAIVPLTLLASNTRHMARLFIRTCMFGLFGILPLLFRPQELLFKATLYIGWMCGVTYALDAIHHDSTGGGRRRRTILTTVDIASSVILACVLIFMDIVHPLIFVPSGRLEFLPLMITSVVCAVGLVWCWLESCRQMIFGSVRVAWR